MQCQLCGKFLNDVTDTSHTCYPYQQLHAKPVWTCNHCYCSSGKQSPVPHNKCCKCGDERVMAGVTTIC